MLSTRAVYNVSKEMEVQSCKAKSNTYTKHGATVTETDNSRQERSPVVVLLGWNGAQDRHLAKYSESFTLKNFATVRITAHPFNSFFRLGSKCKEIGHDILSVLIEMGCEDRPVFLYAFSFGGNAVFFHIMEALTKPDSTFYGKIQVVGSIFDSCPLYTGMKNVKRVQESLNDRIRNPVLKGFVWCIVGISIPFQVYLNPTVKRFNEDLKASPMLCNQLVLYSKADRLTRYEDVEDYIDARRRQGICVVAQCWEDSSHVNHYREHTDEYLEALNNFVDDCLAGL